MSVKIGHGFLIEDFSTGEINVLPASDRSEVEGNSCVTMTLRTLDLRADTVLRDDSISIWRVGLEWPESDIKVAAQILSSDEQKRAKRFYRLSDRKHFIVARAALRLILARSLKIDPRQILFDYNRFGKPRLADGARHRDIRFNLGHSGGLALFAVAIGREIGVDVELIEPNFATMNLARNVFAPEEVTALSVLSKEDFVAGFYRCWTRKEAYVKAKGLGLSLPMKSFVVSVTPPNQTPLLVADRNQIGEQARWLLADVVVGQDFAATLAIERRTQFHLAPGHSELTGAIP